MRPIAEALIEEACREVAELDAADLAARMRALGRRQPQLLAFVMSTCEELDAAAAELGIYVFFVVHRIFERAAGMELTQVSEERLLAAEEDTDELLGAMGDAHAGFLERIAAADFSGQPELIGYIVDVLAGYGDEEGEAELSAEEQWLLFSMLHTVVEVLDRAKS